MGKNSDIGKAIRMARVSAGESQTQFGEKFGVGHQAVGVWERTGMIPMNRWKKLLDEYGVDVEMILKGGLSVTAKHHSHASGGNMEVTNNHMPKSDLSAEEQTLINLLREKDQTKIYLRRCIAELIMREDTE